MGKAFQAILILSSFIASGCQKADPKLFELASLPTSPPLADGRVTVGSATLVGTGGGHNYRLQGRLSALGGDLSGGTAATEKIRSTVR